MSAVRPARRASSPPLANATLPSRFLSGSKPVAFVKVFRLQPGARLNVSLELTSPSRRRLRFKPHVLVGLP
jgi:hypothetical protein